MSTPILEVSNLSKAYGGVQAVQDVSFVLNAGELLALIGPNGAGKTTCFNMLMGQIKPDSGVIRLKGNDITGRPPQRIWRMGVGRTFQITATFTSMTVRENVQMALINHQHASRRWWKPAAATDVAHADALLGRVGMAEQGDRACSVLAYGDLKRVELAVALANDPDLLLMDEPTAGMAPKERIELMQLAADIVSERGIGVLFTEHDMDVVFAHAHRIMVLNRGCLLAEGAPKSVRANAQVREIYLGSTVRAEVE
ncbi:MAG: ABC transporter ATP-binding protein [Rhodospirillaceae bacterium]|nr:ABC transporter ATP-binding protein [Rhodospirillaceae bacterium]MCY4237728.1 ABC transporter ATP-binding protein [Rhodospirillaceae bacterium]